MTSRTKVICYCDTDLVHSSYAVTGLIELADLGEIDLQFRLKDRSVDRYRGMWTLWLKVTCGDEEERGVCIDCHDSPTYYCPESLAACRWYYKSNIRRQSYDAVPAELREKLRPFGPYLPCRPRRDRQLFRRWCGNLLVKFRQVFLVATNRRTLWQKLRKFAPAINRHTRYASRKTWDQYEVPSSKEFDFASSTILFNPTCWDESEADELRGLNEFRAKLIRALRQEFGNRFIGGFRNSGPSVAQYPDAVELKTIPHDEYNRLLQASPVTVYANGKWGCFSWRLLENLAAGKCQVSERVPNDAGFPLDESAGIIPCESVEEMVAEMRRLMSSPEELRELSQRSRQTYVTLLRPAIRMRRLIHEVIQPADATSGAAEIAM